jgi:hypothetical protein
MVNKDYVRYKTAARKDANEEQYSPAHGFSHCGMCTTTGKSPIIYWYAALIPNRNIKRI